MTGRRRILVARTDRLGDVLLSLPAVEYVRQNLPDREIDFLCRWDLHDVLRPHLTGRRVGLLSEVKDWAGYEAVLFLFASGEDLFRAWKGRVPKRFGVRSKVPSWLWLNRGRVQRRSEGTRSEALYNLDLARELVKELTGNVVDFGAFHLRLAGDAASEATARTALEQAGVTGRYVLLHAGMGGSALNLDAEGYAKLVGAWPDKELVLSLGPSPYDATIVDAVLRRIPRAKRLPRVDLPVLREVFRRADLVVAPSTGPLHLAHYVGTPTLGIFSPVRAHRPERWAPWGGAGKSRVLVPAHPCPGTRACLGERCDRHPCLDKLVREALPTGWADGLMAP